MASVLEVKFTNGHHRYMYMYGPQKYTQRSVG